MSKFISNANVVLFVSPEGFFIYHKAQKGSPAGLINSIDAFSNTGHVKPECVYTENGYKSALTKISNATGHNIHPITVRANINEGLILLDAPITKHGVKWADWVTKQLAKQSKAKAKAEKAKAKATRAAEKAKAKASKDKGDNKLAAEKAKASKVATPLLDKVAVTGKAAKIPKLKKPKASKKKNHRVLVDTSFLKFVDKVMSKLYDLSGSISEKIEELVLAKDKSLSTKIRKSLSRLNSLQEKSNMTMDTLNDHRNVYTRFASNGNFRAAQNREFLTVETKGKETVLKVLDTPSAFS